MKLETIWSLPYISTTERFRRTFDWGAMKTARKLPASLRYWAAVTEIRKVIQGNPKALELPLEQVLESIQKNTNR